MSAWTPITNPDGSESTHGYFYPWPQGWASLPVQLEGLDGAVSFEDPDSPTGIQWFIIKGSPAWRRWLGLYQAGAPGREPIVRGQPISVMPGIVRGSPPTVATEERSAEATGEGDPVTEYTNDPSLGVVPIGVPTDQTFARKVWNAPALALSKLLPAGAIPEGIALGLTVVPFILWGLVAWWVWRKFKR
jgi:hypothetical protein